MVSGINFLSKEDWKGELNQQRNMYLDTSSLLLYSRWSFDGRVRDLSHPQFLCTASQYNLILTKWWLFSICFCHKLKKPPNYLCNSLSHFDICFVYFQSNHRAVFKASCNDWHYMAVFLEDKCQGTSAFLCQKMSRKVKKCQKLREQGNPVSYKKRLFNVSSI